jgi:hypothetical protein
MELVGLVRMKGSLSAYSKTVLAGTAWVYLVLFGLFLVLQFVETESLKDHWLKTIASSSVAAIDSRTAGLPIDGAQPTDLPRGVQLEANIECDPPPKLRLLPEKPIGKAIAGEHAAGRRRSNSHGPRRSLRPLPCVPRAWLRSHEDDSGHGHPDRGEA